MRKSLLIAFAILLQSCLVQTKLVSSKQAGYTYHPKRIYVTIVGSLNTNNFCDGVLTGLIQKFKDKDIASNGQDSFGLSKQTQADFVKGTEEFEPDASLSINLQDIIAMNQGAGGGNFELELIDSKTQSKVWTCSMNITGHLDSKLVINSAVNNIVAKLVADGIIE